MAINFPNSPSDGDTHTSGGKTFTYDATAGLWNPSGSGVTEFTGLSDTPSTLGTAGQIAKVNSGATALEFADPSGVTVYATADLLPGTANAGDMAFVSATNRLYLWNGSGWYNIALINTNPTISGVSSSYALAIDGTATTVTITATDPEGLPITYSIASDTSGNIATVTQSSNVFTITPSTDDANAGTFSLTFRASDGVNIATAVSEFTLQFKVSNSNYTTSLITTAGSAGTNATFTDSSSNSHSITANGNTTQASFSPYRSGGYSAYFDGSGDFIEGPAVDLMGSGAFTVECWAYINSTVSTATDAFLAQYQSNQKFIFGVKSDVVRVWMAGTEVRVGTTNITGEWHHFALVRDSSNSCQVYIDGVAEGAAFTNTTDFSTSLENFEIGSWDNGAGSDLDGYITDLRVVKGTAVYTAAFTPPTERLTAITNTSLLACHLPYIADGSTNNHTLTPNGNVSTKAFAPYDYQEYVVGDHGGSVYLDGSGDYLTIANDASLKPTGDFTAEGWCYVDGTNASGSIFNMWTGSQGRMWALYVSSGGVTLSGNGSNLISHTINNLNKWVHVAFTRDNSNALCTLYVNGKSVGTSTTTFSGSSAPLAIGFNLDNAPASYYYNGSITDLRISDTVRYTSDFTPPTEPFTTDSNTALLLSGQDAKILDKSQSVKEIKLGGNATASTTQYKYLPTSIYLDGSGDYIRADDAIQGITSTTPFTIEAWVYPTQIGTTGDRDYVFGINTLSAGGNILLIGVSNIGVNGSSDDITDLSLNTWSHIAFVYDGSGGWKYYINGTLDYTHSDTITLNGSSFLIGAEADAANAGTLGNYFGGYLSDIRVTKGLQRYTANFTPPSAALDG